MIYNGKVTLNCINFIPSVIDLPINLLKSPKIHLNVVESTNDYAGKYAQDTDFIEGTIIWADFQTAGKGHFGSSWFSSPQKIYY